jgi:hypothetical protein
MGLEKRLTQEALVIAVGKGIVACAYTGATTPLAKRSGDVLALTVHQGRLLDSGNYFGVKDTVTHEKIAGRTMRWSRLTSVPYTYTDLAGLYAAPLLGPDIDHDDERYGIYCLTGIPIQVYRRYGPTTILTNTPALLDCGQYYADESYPTETWVAESANHRYGAGWRIFGDHWEPFTTAMQRGSSLYLATTSKLFRLDEEDLTGIRTHEELEGFIDYRLQHPLLDLFSAFREDAYYGEGSLFKHKTGRILDEAESLVDGAKLKQCYRNVWWHGPDRWGTNLFRRYSALTDYFYKYIGISAVSVAEGELYIGCNDGKLISPSYTNKVGTDIIRQFTSPINAMCVLPEELLSGVRARILRGIETRALHAQKKFQGLRIAA